MAKKTKKPAGRVVSVSPKAHEILLREVFESKPRLNIRKIINIKLGLPKEE